MLYDNILICAYASWNLNFFIFEANSTIPNHENQLLNGYQNWKNHLLRAFAAMKNFWDIVWPYRLLSRTNMILNMFTHTTIMVRSHLENFFEAFERRLFTRKRPIFDARWEPVRLQQELKIGLLRVKDLRSNASLKFSRDHQIITAVCVNILRIILVHASKLYGHTTSPTFFYCRKRHQ